MTVKLIPLTSEQFVFDAKRSLKVSEILNYLHISIKRTALHMAECMLPFWMYWIYHLKYFYKPFSYLKQIDSLWSG